MDIARTRNLIKEKSMYNYSNGIEIANYGILPSMESVVEKGGEGMSMLRNPDIAHQCYYFLPDTILGE